MITFLGLQLLSEELVRARGNLYQEIFEVFVYEQECPTLYYQRPLHYTSTTVTGSPEPRAYRVHP
jgi:hypothetical protein